MFDKSEKEITSKWGGGGTQPLVSVCCATYNQKLYIEKALDSFLMQETSFPFEIIVHDDASTDGTANILQIYQSKFPNIIRLILQSENQYQQGKRVLPIAIAQAKGEYVALCEGDDYWLSKNKLQHQLKTMEKFPDIDLSFHPAVVNVVDSCKSKVANFYSNEVTTYPIESFIRNGGGFCPTSSLIIKREVFINIPDWFYVAPAGDTYFQIMGAAKGGGLYLPEAMSCYREKALGSVSTAAKSFSLDKVLNYLDKDDFAMQSLDKYFNYQFSTSVHYRRAEFCRNFSSSFLMRGLDKDFEILIERSWKISPNINRSQYMMYYLRKRLTLLRVIQTIRVKLRHFNFSGLGKK